MNLGKFCLLLMAALLPAQTVEVARVVSRPVRRTVILNGELLPYQAVDLRARVTGFVEKVLVDRGSTVKQGELLATLAAPEMEAQIAEAQAKIRQAESRLSEARAKLAAARGTYERMKEAAATPGAISGNELELARESVEAAGGEASSAEAARNAAQASLDALKKLQQYLNIYAPFPGVVTDRLAHPGALAGPNSGALLRLEQVDRLRLVVAVPEADYAGVTRGHRVPFRVAAYPDRTFTGVIARVARSIDSRTRTMSVELDVPNADGALAPGMYSEVSWLVRSGRPSLLVPLTSVVTTTERAFVIRVKDGRAEWVDVRRGARDGDQIEVYGKLSPGDTVVLRGSDEIRDGAAVRVKSAS